MIVTRTTMQWFDVDSMNRDDIVTAFVNAGHRDILPEESTSDYITAASNDRVRWEQAWASLLKGESNTWPRHDEPDVEVSIGTEVTHEFDSTDH